MPMRHPNLFHGYLRPDGFFEGWYFRITKGDRSLCFIPGVAVGDDPHAFVQVMDSKGGRSHVLRFALTDFSCGAAVPSIRVGASQFSLAGLRLGIEEPGCRLSGQLKFSSVRSYPRWWLGCGSMGALAQLSFLECYTQICALDGAVSGQITLDSEIIDLTGGRLYVEKNWGHSFPEGYMWTQGGFGEGTGFTCSIGRVPAGPFYFDGMVACLYHGDKVYHFHTLMGGDYDLAIAPDTTYLTARQGRYALKVRIDGGRDMRIVAPLRGNMETDTYESLDGRGRLVLYDLDTGACLLRAESGHMALEIGGSFMPMRETPPISPL